MRVLLAGIEGVRVLVIENRIEGDERGKAELVEQGRAVRRRHEHRGRHHRAGADEHVYEAAILERHLGHEPADRRMPCPVGGSVQDRRGRGRHGQRQGQRGEQ
jgi:hypothetical protein